MLRPQDTATRECKPLTGLWRFRLDRAGEGRSAEWFKRPLAHAEEMPVPASFNDVTADPAVRDLDLGRRHQADDALLGG